MGSGSGLRAAILGVGERWGRCRRWPQRCLPLPPMRAISPLLQHLPALHSHPFPPQGRHLRPKLSLAWLPRSLQLISFKLVEVKCGE